MKTATIWRCLLVVSLLYAFSTNTIHATTTRGLYVNDFKNIIGQEAREDSLLQFAYQQGVNYLLLYNLYHIDQEQFDLSNPLSAQPLAAFIEKAKARYGIVEVGAVGETASSFIKVDLYNASHPNPQQQIDVYNIEFEFWNRQLNQNYYCPTYLSPYGAGCSNEEVFAFYYHELLQIKNLAQTKGKKLETYIGKPTMEQCALIGQTCDRVLVHYYRKSDVYSDGASIYNYNPHRLKALAPESGQLAILPIFSNRPSHMGEWLESHDMDEALETFLYGDQGFNEEEGDWKRTLSIEGDQWYRYTDFIGMPFYLPAVQALAPTSLQKDILEEAPPQTITRSFNTSTSLVSERPQAFPNPVAGQSRVFLSRLDGDAEVALRDYSGRIVKNYQIGAATNVGIEVSDLPAGWYVLDIQEEERRTLLKLLVSY
ncbi:MAG: T9SS type A sorting domain-containing protein [Bacteroidota bacterium]